MLHSESQAFMNQKNTPGHPYIYSFLLALGLMLICALLATSSYRSERKEQEAAEQRKIQEQHKEFLSRKDKAAADCIVSIKNDMQDRLRQSTFEDLLVLFTPCSREEFLSLAGGTTLPEDTETISEERACYFYSISYQSDELYQLYTKAKEEGDLADVAKQLDKFQNRLSFSSIYYNPTELTVGSGSVLLYFYAPQPYDSFSISDTGSHTLTFRFDRDLKDYVLLENDAVVYTPPAKADNNSGSDSAGTSGTNGGSPGLHKNDSAVSGTNQTPAPTAKPKQNDFYDVYDYDDPDDFYYDNEDDFDSYEDTEDYYDEAWDE